MPDFLTLQATFPKDEDYPPRAFRLSALSRVVQGTLYDLLPHAFDEEKSKANEYIPLAKRRPSARTRICRTVVNDSVSLLFSEGHFPKIEATDEDTRQALAQLVKDAQLNTVMIDAATRGSVGSVAILLRVLQNRLFFSVLETPYLTPEWEDEAPDTLKSVTELRKVKGRVLKATGYSISDDDSEVDFWFQRVWDGQAETWFSPIKVTDVKDGKKAAVDKERTTEHKLGFVPMVWVKNLPGGDDIDGDPTFPPEAVDTQIEADYLLSQGGRGLKYQSDPTLHIKEPAMGEDGKIVRGAGNAIVTSENGDAKMLEISGDAAHTVMDWVKGLREIALEGAGGNRANADKLSAAQSGRAMELMNQALIWLSDKLRISYGEGALMALLSMVIAAQKKFTLVDKKGKKLPELKDDGLALRWPAWYAPTYADKQTEATTMDSLRLSGLISQETAVKAIAPSYDIDDVQNEIAQIKADDPPPNAALPKEPKPDPDSKD